MHYPLISALLLWPATGSASASPHEDPVGQLAIALAIILLVAKLAGHVAVRMGQPSVLGELIGGVILGNLGLLGFGGLDWLKADGTIDMLAGLGALILLFEVGLESTIAEMAKVGLSSLLVAILGVAAPLALGLGVGAWLLPDEGFYAHAFLGAALTATSVGITARVLKDLGRSQTGEARVILGAAVIDDVLGLVVLAVVTGLIAAANEGGALGAGEVAATLLKAVGFLAAALLIGSLGAGRLFTFAARLRADGVLLSLALALCFSFAWLAGLIGLAPIVGAFAAGLVLEERHFARFAERGEKPLAELITPISTFLVPIFFVLMGMRTDLRALVKPDVIGLAAALTAAAVIGKQLCSLGVVGGKVDRLTVGIGMIPRGEVGLIFANVGLGLTLAGERVVNESTYSAIVAMVIATTIITPPALKASLARLPRPGH